MISNDTAFLKGLNVNKTNLLLLVVISLSVGICISFVGPIGFIGLVVPHIIKLIYKQSADKLFFPVFFFGGATGGGASMLAAGLMATGKQILESVLSVYIVTESVGKLISVFIAYFIIKAIPERSLVKYKYGEKFIKTKSN